MALPVSEGVRPGAAGPPSAAAGVLFKGNGFSIQVPAGWDDLTIYTLEGPVEKEMPHWLRISVDRGIKAASAAEYGDPRVRNTVETLPGGRLQKRSDVKLACGVIGSTAEIRWYATDEMRIYHRLLFVLWQETGFTLFTQLSKKSRATLGPSLDRLMGSFRPVDPRSPAPPPPAGLKRFRANQFSLDHPEAWVDRTTYTLAEPDVGGFRRNLVVHRAPLPEPPASIAEVAAAEGEAMKATIEGVEILEKGSASVKDGHPAARLVIRRPAREGKVLQTQVFAFRSGILNVLSFTCEESPPDAVKRLSSSLLSSFAADPAQSGTK